MTPAPAGSVLRAALVLLTTACALLAGGVALAGPAAALGDHRRPRAEVTHGPSCGPGVVRVVVTNGTAAHRVALVFDGDVEQDSAVLGGGEQVELRSSDVGWGRTVDVSLTVAGSDGTVQVPIGFGTYTRPSAEDCAAATAPTVGAAAGTVDGPAVGAPSPSVAPGGAITVRATGFSPGEPVVVSLQGVDDPLSTVTAAADGSVEAVVRIPRRAGVGTATVQLVGGRSAAAAGLDVQVAPRSRPVTEQVVSAPGLAAGTALVAAAGLLGGTASRRPCGAHAATRRGAARIGQLGGSAAGPATGRWTTSWTST